MAATLQRSRLAVILLSLAWAAQASGADNSVNVAYLQGKAPVAPDAISQLGPDLFGDQVNLYNGSFAFEQTDTELPGNSALRVALIRTHEPGRQWQIRGALGDWDLNTPRIQGSFADPEGWIPHYGSPSNRCSAFDMPPYVARGGFAAEDFSPDEYWGGTMLVVPGHGTQEILAKSAIPDAGSGWPLATRNLWKIGCLAQLKNAAGQGFVARSPEGVTYYFDWMASRVISPLRKADAVLGRREMFLMATLVTDRFGNKVHYEYSAAHPMLLTSISSKDGRLIRISYEGGRVSSVNDGTRTFRYLYNADGDLENVVLPDESRWTFSLRSLVVPQGRVVMNGGSSDCDSLPSMNGYATSGWMRHPSGAEGSFHTDFIMQGRSNVERVCTYHSGELGNYTNGAVHPKSTVNQALIKKEISGPGMATMTWQYINGADPWGSWMPCTTCAGQKTVKVIEPDIRTTIHTYGTRWRENEGQLLKVEETDAKGNVLRSREIRYRQATGQRFPAQFGTSVRFTSDRVSTLNLPEDRREITQQGTSFVWAADDTDQGFDTYARPLRWTASSSLGDSRKFVREYQDFPTFWVMGQQRRLKNAEDGTEIESTDFHELSGLPSARHAFGFKTQGMKYRSDGTLEQLSDDAGNTITFDLFHRGQPQWARFADGTEARQAINNLGHASSHTNEVGSVTKFEFDAMGRVARIIYPQDSGVTYHDTVITLGQAKAGDPDLAEGQWRQTVSTGNAVTERWLDGLWRTRRELRKDANDEANTATAIETRFDAAGRMVFKSYPQRKISVLDQGLHGTNYAYDALNRLTSTQANIEPEGSTATTTTEYLASFQKRVTDPRGNASTFRFQAFDEPRDDAIVGITLPEGVSVSIPRDAYGKALSITRRGPSPSGEVSTTRSYAYDVHQRLCKTVEPETGATVQGYDAAGNLAWRVAGQPAGAGCSEAVQPTARKISFTHDARNRLKRTAFGDNRPEIALQYTKDGLLASAVSSSFTWTYRYNNRGLLTQEAFSVPGQLPTTGWNFTRTIDDHGNVSAVTDYWGTMTYKPNALGQPTEVSGYASDVRYHPNGMVAGYLLVNGIRHSVSLNVRGLPATWRDGDVVNDAYTYDANGNVTGIDDLLNPPRSAANPTDRTMGPYDGLDRLTRAVGPWGTAEYRYDGLDNMRYSRVGARELNHEFGDSTGRLTRLAGTQIERFSYDVQGNVVQRGARSYSFDIANRMRSVGGLVTYYDYDAHGRRSWVVWADGQTQLNAYGFGNASGSTGRLLFSAHKTKGATRYVYLGDKLIAEHNNQSGLRFGHTDALGSPVAWTSWSGVNIPITRYEPYGATAEGPKPNTLGFTGHVNDPETGLVYMQQRYYDPIAGRFLSVDPVVTDAKTGSSFNRYVYGNNSPYKYVDPDGRNPLLGVAVGIGVEVFKQMVIEGKSFGELDRTDIVVAGAIGMIFPGAVKGLSEIGKSSAGVSKNMAAISTLQGRAANTPNRAVKILSGIEKNVTEAAKKVGDAGSTSALAATGVAAKGAVQEVVNNRQETSGSSGSNSSSNPVRVDPHPQDKPR